MPANRTSTSYEDEVSKLISAAVAGARNTDVATANMVAVLHNRRRRGASSESDTPNHTDAHLSTIPAAGPILIPSLEHTSSPTGAVNTGGCEHVAKARGMAQAIIAQNYCPATIVKFFYESRSWSVALGNPHQVRLPASAASNPRLIEADMARRSGGRAGRHVEGQAYLWVRLEPTFHPEADLAK